MDADLQGAAAAHLAFGKKLLRRKRKVRVYNPVREQHGWASTHTVIEIVNDDMPFLVDSVTMEVNRQGLTLHLVIHPVLRVRARRQGGVGLGLASRANRNEGRLESFMHLEVDRQTDPAKLAELEAGIAKVLADVRAAVEDWKPMQERMREVIAALDSARSGVPQAELEEGRAFLEWLLKDNFTFLGCRDYEIASRKRRGRAAHRSGQRARHPARAPGRDGLGELRHAAAEARKRARVKELLVLTKANARSTVHRPGHLDYVGVKHFDAKGEVRGETRFLGLYTHTAYAANPTEVPLLRRKLAAVIGARRPAARGPQRQGARLDPRDATRATSCCRSAPTTCYRHAMAILQLGERQRLRLLVRHDAYGRFVTCLIFVPRERYNTELRERFQKILTEAFNGVSSDFDVDLSAAALGRILMRIRTRPGADGRRRRTSRRSKRRLVDGDAPLGGRPARGARRAPRRRARERACIRIYENAFPASYREEYSVHEALDRHRDDRVARSGRRPRHEPAPCARTRRPGMLNFKIYRRGGGVPLSDSVPMLERLGVRVQYEHPHEVDARRRAGRRGWWTSAWCRPRAAELDVDEGARRLPRRVLRHVVGHDRGRQPQPPGAHRGAVGARDRVLRAYARYLRQGTSTFSLAYVEQALAAHPRIAALLVRLFFARFERREGDEAKLRRGDLARRSTKCENLDEDRILRSFLAVMQATTRTNYFLEKPYCPSSSTRSACPGCPSRGRCSRSGCTRRASRACTCAADAWRAAACAGRTAWRTSAPRSSGLMKAQMVKNVVIVPVGAKGGFVVKRAARGRARGAR